MTIVIVNTFYYPDIVGGTEVSVQKLAEGLAEKRHKIHIICTSDTEETKDTQSQDTISTETTQPPTEASASTEVESQQSEVINSQSPTTQIENTSGNYHIVADGETLISIR